MPSMTGRQLTPEFMDDPGANRQEQAEALHFIRLVNARLGGAAAALSHLERWTQTFPKPRLIRILDVATGSADIPLAIAQWAQRQGRRVHITAVDLHPVTLDLAREYIINYGR